MTKGEKEKFTWTGFGLPLAWLAELDHLPALNALPDAFGDSYLYRYCPVFGSIRDAVLQLGFSFSRADTPGWRDYQCFPLMSLARILAEKTIPYLDTGTTFQRLIQECPTVQLPPALITGNLRANHVFHESAHCVAHSILQSLHLSQPQAPACAAADAILAESFANTAEALGATFCHLPVSDQVFYTLNSYFSAKEKMRDLLTRASALGAEHRFTVLFFAYFQANLSPEPLTDESFDQIADASGCSRDARELANLAFSLRLGFRESTNPAYFELLGRGDEYRRLSSANWLGNKDNQEFARQACRQFWEAAGRP